MRGSRSHSSDDSGTSEQHADAVEPVWLDYAAAARSKKFLHNLSAVCAAGRFLWTASDEGRTVECLERHRAGYRLKRQHHLDDLFPDLPGRATHDEADIESLDCDGRQLWLSGSHCRVRGLPAKPGELDVRIVPRRSHHLLGALALAEGGGELGGGAEALPFAGRGSLRRRLREEPHLTPFAALPSGENGFDVEGLAVTADRVFLGLRGPLLDSNAVVVEAVRGGRSVVRRARPTLHFLDLAGLGVRDLARHEQSLFVLAGPAGAAEGPFALHQWRPRYSAKVHQPPRVWCFPMNGERPEGIAALARDGRDGLLILYDAPDGRRIDGSRYRADWIPLAALGG